MFLCGKSSVRCICPLCFYCPQYDNRFYCPQHPCLRGGDVFPILNYTILHGARTHIRADNSLSGRRPMPQCSPGSSGAKARGLLQSIAFVLQTALCTKYRICITDSPGFSSPQPAVQMPQRIHDILLRPFKIHVHRTAHS